MNTDYDVLSLTEYKSRLLRDAYMRAQVQTQTHVLQEFSTEHLDEPYYDVPSYLRREKEDSRFEQCALLRVQA